MLFPRNNLKTTWKSVSKALNLLTVETPVGQVGIHIPKLTLKTSGLVRRKGKAAQKLPICRKANRAENKQWLQSWSSWTLACFKHPFYQKSTVEKVFLQNNGTNFSSKSHPGSASHYEISLQGLAWDFFIPLRNRLGVGETYALFHQSCSLYLQTRGKHIVLCL